jgi:hypothetical protein
MERGRAGGGWGQDVRPEGPVGGGPRLSLGLTVWGAAAVRAVLLLLGCPAVTSCPEAFCLPLRSLRLAAKKIAGSLTGSCRAL